MTGNIFVEKVGIVQTNLYIPRQKVIAMSHDSQVQRRGIFVGIKFKERKTKVVKQNIEYKRKDLYLINIVL